MKKVLFFVILLVGVGAHVFADGESFLKVQSLIDRGLFRNKSEIQSLAGSLTTAEKAKLIEDNKLYGSFPVYMNSALGYGVGSFLAKDYVGGAVHCSIDIACDVVMIAMFAVYAKSILDPISDHNVPNPDKVINNAKNYLYAGLATTVVLLVNRIAQVVSVRVHIGKYNASLSEILLGGGSSSNPDGKAAFNLIPVMDEKRIGIGVNIALPNKA